MLVCNRVVFTVQVTTGNEDEDFAKYVVAAYDNFEMAEKHTDIINTLADYFGVNDDPMFGFDFLGGESNDKFEETINKVAGKLEIPNIARSGGVFASTKELEILDGIPEELMKTLNTTDVSHGTN